MQAESRTKETLNEESKRSVSAYLTLIRVPEFGLSKQATKSVQSQGNLCSPEMLFGVHETGESRS